MPIHVRNSPRGLVRVEGPSPDATIAPGVRTSPSFATIRVASGSVALDVIRASAEGERWRLTVEGDLSSTDLDATSAELLAEVLRRLMR